MTNIALFEKVAAREIEPREAADKMIAADQQATQDRRPRWFPKRIWTFAIVLLGASLAAVGGRQS